MVFQQVAVISHVRRGELVTSLNAYVELCVAYVCVCVCVCVCKAEKEEEERGFPPPLFFLFHFFLAVLFRSHVLLSPVYLCSVLSPAYSGDLIARGPGRILGRFWRREPSGTGCGRRVASIHTHTRTYTHTKMFSPAGIDTCFHSIMSFSRVNCFLTMLSF